VALIEPSPAGTRLWAFSKQLELRSRRKNLAIQECMNFGKVEERQIMKFELMDEKKGLDF
jgi:hypothetical protein